MDAKEWIIKLEEYRDFFNTTTLPPGPIKVDNYSTINDIRKYIDTNLTVASQKPGNVWFEGAMLRLEWLKNYLIEK